jgi:hypothetical protein
MGVGYTTPAGLTICGIATLPQGALCATLGFVIARLQRARLEKQALLKCTSRGIAAGQEGEPNGKLNAIGSG